MALINCPECGKEISDTCESCIHCGYKLSNHSSIKPVAIESKYSDKKKIPTKIIVSIIIACVLLFIILVVKGYKDFHTYSYEERMSYLAVYYFSILDETPKDVKITEVKIAPSMLAGLFPDSDGYYSEYVVAIYYTSKNNLNMNIKDEYYVGIEGDGLSRNNFSSFYTQENLKHYFVDTCSIDINVRKINYALEHPEVLDE